MEPQDGDGFLDKRIARYDEWLRDGKISFSSRVVPVSESIEAKQQVFPTEKALEILGKSRLIALQDCAGAITKDARSPWMSVSF